MADEQHFMAAESGFRPKVCELLARYDAPAACDVGGGRRPQLGLDEIAQLGVGRYVVLDVDPEELARTPEGYEKICADAAGPEMADYIGQFDVMFSKMVAEHVPDGERFHRNIFHALKPGGVAFHYYPTIDAPIFLANRLTPEPVSTWVYERMAKRKNPKFPARYSWCRPATSRMAERFRSIGYSSVEFRGFYGYYYFDRVPVVRRVDRAYWRAAQAVGRGRFLTSYGYLTLSK